MPRSGRTMSRRRSVDGQMLRSSKLKDTHRREFPRVSQVYTPRSSGTSSRNMRVWIHLKLDRRVTDLHCQHLHRTSVSDSILFRCGTTWIRIPPALSNIKHTTYSLPFSLRCPGALFLPGPDRRSLYVNASTWAVSTLDRRKPLISGQLCPSARVVRIPEADRTERMTASPPPRLGGHARM